MNKLRFTFSIFIGKLAFLGLKLLKKQGTALPGKIALKIYPNILKYMGNKCDKIVIITGTNGKTTTNNLINHVLSGKYSVVSNIKGSNMIQGVVTPFIVDSAKRYDWGVFEVDEGSIPIVSQYITADYMILTNFFRDQLDRYGEVDSTVKLVKSAIKPGTTLILNGDDPLNSKFEELPNKKIYYGVLKNKLSKSELSVAEAIFCSKCGNRLEYNYLNYGNIGHYKCRECGLERPKLKYYVSSVDVESNKYKFTANSLTEKNSKFVFRYLGLYNIYNCIAAIAFSYENGLKYDYVKNKLENFDYKLGRMETIKFKTKDVILILSKNPVGLSEVLSTIGYDTNKKSVMFVLNDASADGKDISWIWDADMEQIANINTINKFYASGHRSEEVALRLKYAGFDEEKIKIYESTKENNIKNSIKNLLKDGESKSYVIGTFTAMPVARNILIKEQTKEKENYS
ncbi:MurT ligase domain-containing protein [Methanobrevibacter filiformis]|uniref:Lipid II isoglutaminyl synthase (glutamine-hydrolyzing) subunit MurT n=1 Tax=Methanobrevibacter filiformis TaxID=55758 RepID=A0A162FF22_9EURY|nr:MurT ligase domain-containing protein [Methanobrevibacter filiformis]KZX12135.1 UDP-N-acetylmuramoyl-L-alanyl-D-glutamate--2,6-diaminopimelate ligase [Methanobrevibacter filiformis]